MTAFNVACTICELADDDGANLITAHSSRFIVDIIDESRLSMVGSLYFNQYNDCYFVCI